MSGECLTANPSIRLTPPAIKAITPFFSGCVARFLDFSATWRTPRRVIKSERDTNDSDAERVR